MQDRSWLCINVIHCSIVGLQTTLRSINGYCTNSDETHTKIEFPAIIIQWYRNTATDSAVWNRAV